MIFDIFKRFQRTNPSQLALSDEEQSDFDADFDMRSRPSPPSHSSDDGEKTNNATTSRRKSEVKTFKEDSVSDKVEDELENEEGDGEEDEDDDEEEELFVVEKILGHMVDKKGNIRFQVKWEGYDSKKDLTWEPEDNLTEATEVLQEYFAGVGGRQAILDQTEKAKAKKRGRTGSDQPAGTKRQRKNGVHPADTEPPATKKKWQPPSGSWEDDIENIDACEEEGGGKLVVYLNWKNGQKTKHETSVIYKKCPQKMLQFYERHVKIIREENKSLVGNDD
ncbi:unnamed protein product [Clonostachys rosea f. rosea IK726]|uniref:Chromo domain-containing protein n=2 Tax=Bionectria ochroleuca TaxID=29856 RepID=A0A0B7K057_BIOOC|nr:unnamed protein product [Clonostachys rosea f. rosea IK726]